MATREIGRPPLPNSVPTRGWGTRQAPLGHSSSVSEYPPLSPKISNSNIGKRRKSQSEIIDPTKHFLAKVPNEVLIYILSCLDPMDLKLASGVCKRWNLVVIDDNCWRLAFEKYFGSFPLRRITFGSWRREYLTRCGLLKEWGKGRQAVQFEPRIGRIPQICLDFEKSKMYAGSLEKGMIAICNPFTGKVEKEAIFCESEERQSSEISVLKMDKLRIVVGHLTGHISIITNFKDGLDYSVKKFNGFHQGPVACITWSAVNGAIISGGVDGQIKIWDVVTCCCVKTLHGNQQKITHLELDPRKSIIAATEDGSILLWNLDVSSLITTAVKSTDVNSDLIPILIAPIISSDGSKLSVKSMIYDPISETCVVAYNSASNIGLCRWNTKTGKMFQKFNDAHSSKISFAVWDKLVSGHTERGTSIIATGDQSGIICLWEVNDKASESLQAPTRKIFGHSSEISHLYIDPFKIVSVDVFGVIKIWDCLNMKCIRALNNKRARNGLDENQSIDEHKVVNSIWGSAYQIIASVGNTIKSWNFDPFQNLQSSSKSNHKKRTMLANSSRNTANPSRTSARNQERAPRHQFLYEMREEITRANDDRSYQKALNERMIKQQIKLNGPIGSNASSMTEDELVSYAMMLSMDQNPNVITSDLLTPPSAGCTPKEASPRYGSRRNSFQDRFNEWDDDENDIDMNNIEYYSPKSRGKSSIEMDVDWTLENPSELSTSGGRRRLFYGMGNTSTGKMNSNEISSRHASSAAGILLRSPGLLPINPGRFGGNVQVAQRPTSNTWDDEELQYVLEMSVHDK